MGGSARGAALINSGTYRVKFASPARGARSLSEDEAEHLARVVTALTVDPFPDGVTKFHVIDPPDTYDYRDARLTVTYLVRDGIVRILGVGATPAAWSPPSRRPPSARL